MLDGSNIPHVERANPEEFIHLFLNSSERLVEFLEHLVKVLNFSNSFIKAEVWNTKEAERTHLSHGSRYHYCCFESRRLQ
jgi:hypothetical protein